MSLPIILHNQHPKNYLSMKESIAVIEEVLAQQMQDHFIAPARHHFRLGEAELVFTLGGKNKGSENYCGFRVYHSQTPAKVRESQITIVYNKESILEGIYIGNLLSEWRCGAIGGLAIKKLAPNNTETLGLIGCGNQACTQLVGALAVHNFKRVLVYARNSILRSQFIKKLETVYQIKGVESIDEVEELTRLSDVLICATSSKEPILKFEWLKPNVHINNIGPKLKQQSELPPEVYLNSQLIYTDSVQQAFALGDKFILNGTSAWPQLRKLPISQELPATIKDRKKGISIFISLGLAGTEVAIAKKIFEKCKYQETLLNSTVSIREELEYG